MNFDQITKGYTKTTLSRAPLFDFVGDTEKRWKQIGSLIKKILAKYKNPKILDLAMGSGQDSISLLQEGYNVTSNEIDPEGIALARENAGIVGVSLDIRKVDWVDMELSPLYQLNEFDFILSLGNSFPNYLFKEADRQKALRSFWKILKPGGTLLFDSRNFDYILENAKEILKDPERNFKYTYKSTYVGREVKGFPIKITKDKIDFLWKHYKNRRYAELSLWPATIKNVTSLIKSVLGDVPVEIYYDYQKKKPRYYDFVQYVVRKL